MAQPAQHATHHARTPRHAIEPGQEHGDGVQGPTAAATAAPAATDTSDDGSEQTWVCCDDCKKWRRVSDSQSLRNLLRAPSGRPWHCRRNCDARYSSCATPQELTDEQIDAELNTELAPPRKRSRGATDGPESSKRPQPPSPQLASSPPPQPAPPQQQPLQPQQEQPPPPPPPLQQLQPQLQPQPLQRPACSEVVDHTAATGPAAQEEEEEGEEEAEVVVVEEEEAAAPVAPVVAAAPAATAAAALAAAPAATATPAAAVAPAAQATTNALAAAPVAVAAVVAAAAAVVPAAQQLAQLEARLVVTVQPGATHLQRVQNMEAELEVTAAGGLPKRLRALVAAADAQGW